MDQELDGAITQLIQDGEIEGRLGKITLIHTLGIESGSVRTANDE